MSSYFWKWFGVLVISLCVVQPARGQPAITLSGVVVDQSGGTLPDVQVIAVSLANGLQRQAVSDAEGRFVIAMLPAGSYTVTALRPGFAAAQVKDLRVVAGEEASIRLELQIAPLNEVVSVQIAPRSTEAAPTIDVTPLEVRSIAGATENIYHVLHALPGITAVNDFDSRISVRGGGPDQNLTMLDGVEIHNPYRLFGLTSAFNPETVESFELMAGGFSAKYGDRLSSILVIDSRDGTRQEPFAGSASMALTDGNIVTEGKLPGKATGSWLLTGRRTYYDLVAEPIVGSNLPGFTDVQLRAVWEPAPGRRLSIFGLGSRERTDLDFDELDTGGERFDLESSTNNDLAAVAFSSPIGQHASSRTTVSWYRNRETFDFDGTLRDGLSRRSNRPEDDAQPYSNVVFTRGVGVRDVAVRQELTAMLSPTHLIEAGFESHALESGWDWTITGDRDLDEANGSSNQGGSGLPSLLRSSRSTWRAGGWLTDRWALTPRLTAEPGLRIDWSGLADEVIVSPRLALIAHLPREVRVRVAGGLFTQSPGYEKLLQSDYFFDLSDADDLRLRSERAWHALVGVERSLGRGVVARAEGYYKRFDRLLVGRLEGPDDLAARRAGYDFPAALSEHVPSQPQITSVPGNDGAGEAYGVEFFVARKATSASDRLSGWLSYTWGRTNTTAYGRTYAADYDRPQALSLVANFRLSRLIELATTVRVQSGFPYTAPVGVRVAAVADAADGDGDGNLTELVPQQDRQGLPVWVADFGGVSELNSRRLPVFGRVNLRVTFRPRWQSSRWLLYFEAINALNQKNSTNPLMELVYDPTSDRPQVVTTQDGSLPLLPSFGVRLRF